jgi:acyl-CoA synthetase (NDP forming)
MQTAMQRDLIERFKPLFEPRAIAVAGASSTNPGVANNFLRNLKSGEFAGRVYIVHPIASEVDGYPAYPSFAALPEAVDYAYIAVAADRTPALFSGANGKLHYVQVISSGFSETKGGAQIEAELVKACRATGARLLGPNCLGLYSPRGRVSFMDRVSMEVGRVGVVSQSGGLAADILRRGQVRGVRFSALVTIGNSADLGPCDLLEYMLADDRTRVVGLYLEGLDEGRRFFELLRAVRARKPVVILKGGRTAAGQRASASHTGALAQDDRLWLALSRQTGAILVDGLDQFIDALLIFQHLNPHSDAPTKGVVLFGNGGGASVLATDAFSRAGFEIPAFSDATLSALRNLRLAAGSSIENPVDTPAGALRQDGGRQGERILEAVFAEPGIGAVVMHLNMPVLMSHANTEILPNLIGGAVSVGSKYPGKCHFILVLRSDGQLDIEAQKQAFRCQALAAGIPVFNELTEASNALRALSLHESFLHELERPSREF